MKKIITTIFVFAFVFAGVMNANSVFATDIEGLLHNGVFFQDSEGYAKIEFTADTDFSLFWEKDIAGIHFIGTEDIQVPEYSIVGWTGNAGLVPEKNSLTGLEIGIHEFAFVEGNTYEVYLVDFTTGSDGLIDPDNFIRQGQTYTEVDYIVIKWNFTAESTYFYYGETIVVYGCTDPEANNYDPEATDDDSSCEYGEEFGGLIVVSASAGISNALGVANDLFGDLGQFVYMFMGIPFGLGVIKKTIGLFHKR